MSVNRNTATALKNLGLSDYEIKAYVANISLVIATASEISLASNVPRSKIYEVLKSLAKKEFIEKQQGKPLKFNVIPPHEIMGKSRKQFNEKLDEAEAELNSIYEKQIPNVPAPLWLIHGPDKILKKEVEIISRAKKSIYILGGLLFNDEVPELKESLNKAIKRGVHVKIILSPFYRDDETVNLNDLHELDCEIKTLNVPLVKVIIRDDKEMLMGVSKIEDKKIMSRSAIGIWNQYSELVETIEGLYNFIWTTELFNKQE
ncbi:MAG: TrmB family transcriptional regulator [Methanobacterium sp.]|nr:TrmB family transcriptional regulator [Methanobacterium sp.]